MQSVCTCSVSATLSLLVRGDNLGNFGQTTPKFHWNLTQNYHFWDHFPQAPEKITDDLTTWMDRLKPYWSHSSLCWQITAHLAYWQPVFWTKKPHYPSKISGKQLWDASLPLLNAPNWKTALCFMNTIEDLSYWFYDKIWNITSNDAHVIFQFCLPRGNLFIIWFPHLRFANCPGELFETKTMTSISSFTTPRTLSWPVNLFKAVCLVKWGLEPKGLWSKFNRQGRLPSNMLFAGRSATSNLTLSHTQIS